MPNVPLDKIRLEGWKDGVNLEADDSTLENSELSLAENIELGLNGELKKRKGYTEYTTSKHANMAAGRRLFYWNQLGSANDYFIYVDSDGDVFKSVNGDFSAAADFDIAAHTGVDDYPIGMGIYKNEVYLTSLRANARYFNGTSWTEVTDYTMDGGGSQFPRASYLAVKHERMFAANIDNNGTRERSRIRWSAVADARTWESTSWLDVDPDDGTEITALAGFADGIVIFKEKSMFFLSGVDENSFTLFPVDSTIGTQSPGSVVVTESAVYFLDNTRGVYKFDGADVSRISDKVNTALLAGISFANRHLYRGLYHREKYYLCLNDGTTNNFTWVYDARNEGAWVRWTNGFHDAAVRDGQVYVVGAVDSADTESTGIFQWINGEADNGVSYTAKAITGWVAPSGDGWSGKRFRIRNVDVVSLEGAGTLTVNLYEDFRTTLNAGTASLDADGYDHVHRRVVFTPALQSGRTNFQLEFSLASTTNTFAIAGVDVWISERQRQRGGNI